MIHRITLILASLAAIAAAQPSLTNNNLDNLTATAKDNLEALGVLTDDAGPDNTAVNNAIAAAPAATRAASESVGYESIFDSSGATALRMTGACSPYTDADADAVISAAGVTDEKGKKHYQRVVQLLKSLDLWDTLENGYLIGTLYQSSSTTLKSLTGGSDATGTSTFGAHYATFNGTSSGYSFSNGAGAINKTDWAAVTFYKASGAQAVQALISSYQGGSTRGPALSVGGAAVGGASGPTTTDNIYFLAAEDDGATTQTITVDLASDTKWSFAGASYSSGIMTLVGNSRNPTRGAITELWSNNATYGIGKNSNSSQFFSGDMCFAALWDGSISDARMFALKCGLENIFATNSAASGAVVFDGNSLTASAPGGGTTWPSKLIASSGWNGVTRSANLAADGAKQTGKVENQYFTAAKQWIPSAGQDSVFFLWSGINDITASISTSDITASLKRSIIRAKLDGFRVVILTLTPVAPASGDYTLSYEYSPTQIAAIATVNEWIRETAPALGAQVVDLDEIGGANPAFLTPWVDTYYVTGDGLHHNDAGRALIAAKVAAEVVPPSAP